MNIKFKMINYQIQLFSPIFTNISYNFSFKENLFQEIHIFFIKRNYLFIIIVHFNLLEMSLYPHVVCLRLFMSFYYQKRKFIQIN